MSLSLSITHPLDRFELSVDIRTGPGVTGLFGPSGAGKTTLTNAVSGLLSPNQGRITLDDEVLFDRQTGINLPPERRRIGTVFQEARLFPHLNVSANINFGQRFLPRHIRRSHQDVIDMLDIGPLLTRKPGTLSGGEKQRVAIARALMMQPRLLIMDEPLAALDMPRKQEVLPYLERLCHVTGVPILYVSHALTEMARLADHLVILRAGRVVSTGDTQTVLSDPEIMPLIGIQEAGSVLKARVLAHDTDGLSRLSISGGEILLPGVTAPIGTDIRLRIPAKDVILSLSPPKKLSAHNILPVTVLSIRPGDGPGAAVQLQIGQDRILARVTSRAVESLALRPGLECYALLGATALPRGEIGGGT